jgi:NADH-quinone oxidoreductase subunit F
MDLRFSHDEASPTERAAIDALIGPPVSGWDGGTRDTTTEGHSSHGGHAARSQRQMLLPALWALQEHIGWISPGGLDYICRRLQVPPADAYGVATFYGLLATTPRPQRVLHVCEDLACLCSGASDVMNALERTIGPEGTVNPAGCGTWLKSPCLGQCDRAPAAMLSVSGDVPEEHTIAPVAPAQALATLDGDAVAWDPITPLPQHGETGLRLLARVGVVDPSDLDDYRAHGGLVALERAIALGPQGVLAELEPSRLLGRGGAAFPTATKWAAVAGQSVTTRYVVANADESEPGTFKDRVLMEGDPFALIEAMVIAGHTVGAERGYIYLRGEYPQALGILHRAISVARSAGLLGQDVCGHGFAFDVEIRRGAGAYICGEETAIFNSIEGFRGEPRSKPPFPVERGLFDKPTLVNNIETLVSVLDILTAGGAQFAQTGTAGSTGTKLFCVSGHVARPGVYEVPFGTTLGELLVLAGAPLTGRPLGAILLGGAAGGFVRPDELDIPLTFEGTRAAGTALGSGVVMAFDDQVDLPRMLMRIAAFFRNESCGQCVPCRVGTVRQQETLARLVSGRTRGSVADELALVDEIGQCMRDASICGLGQTAYGAIESAISRLGVFAGGATHG